MGRWMAPAPGILPSALDKRRAAWTRFCQVITKRCSTPVTSPMAIRAARSSLSLALLLSCSPSNPDTVGVVPALGRAEIMLPTGSGTRLLPTMQVASRWHGRETVSHRVRFGSRLDIDRHAADAEHGCKR